jgi:sterol desaturase/sphingolipid hydroxylase (fatty acid hydroxylase superfamily)
LGGYLGLYWMSGWMPTSYYSFSGHIQWNHVIYQLLLQDMGQYIMHRIEHMVPLLYKRFHGAHHTHIEPTIYDAFDGTLLDTTFMILIPLFVTSRIVHTNIWSYMTFGTIYANMLTLIHSEFSHPWDPYARILGIGTQYDHRHHHTRFKCNYGHLFMYWDYMCHTYDE